ncbi:PAS domain-containing protein [Chondromyces crocatus]|uniref:histidine kinase n=1 Tax=Chondromyces crocatus TaxID=52 RepID=A0A0K1ESS1_CHOCO|nr:PAS domain-containing protein [Chondromyces crocatus]AKT43916.1 two-component hybrid sensor and regulator [Chondromyces crocatus]
MWLIVDSPEHALLVRDLLTAEHGFEVLHDARRALQLLERDEAPARLIVHADAPDPSIVTLCQRVRASRDRATLPLLVLLSPGADALRLEALRAGANDAVVAPLSAAELHARVDVLLDTARAHAAVTVERDRIAQQQREDQQGEIHFRAVADDAPAMLWITRPDSKCVYMSRGWYEFTGQTEDAGLGFGWLDAIHPDERAKASEAFLLAAERRVPFTIDYRLRCKDGRYRWAIDAGRPRFGSSGEFLGFIGSIIDINSWKEAEAELRDAKERLREAVDAAEFGTWRIDLVRGIDNRDAGFNRILGLPAEDTASTVFEVFSSTHPDDLAAAQATWDRALRECGVYEIVHRIIRPDGAVRWIRNRGQVLTGDGGRPVTATGTVIDITEQKQSELEREVLLESERAARAEAERASRTKDELVAVVSHELRTPLNAILGWAQLLRRPTRLPEQIDKGLEVIERNARMQAQLVSDLLDVSRIVTGKLHVEVLSIDLEAVVHAALDDLRAPAAAKGITLRARIEPMDVPVQGDANRLQQVVVNLVSNAIKFTPRGGLVDLVLERTGAWVELLVRDTGQGIAPEILPHIFDRFRQADSSTARRHGGLGLGLSIVKHLVERHGGRVRAESNGDGQGATFKVELPCEVIAPLSSPHSVRPPRPRGERTSLEGVKVLIVDDEPDALELTRRVLEEQNATVTTALSGAEALKALRADPPHVLVSDIGMPGMDGYTLIREVRADERAAVRDIPALAMTAFVRAEDQRRALDAGFHAHMAKPIEPAELVAIVSNLAPDDVAPCNDDDRDGGTRRERAPDPS